MAEPLFRRLALLGIGLIGSSVARIARERGDLAARSGGQRAHRRRRWTGCASWASPTGSSWIPAGPSPARTASCCARRSARSPTSPPRSRRIWRRAAVLTDVGSTKQSVIRDVGPLVPAGVHFVPAHPVAGTEYSGPDAGFTTLFEGRWTC